jgi:hypothetical protein
MSISGLPGLYKMLANRPNGLIVEDIDTKKKRFCSVRKHQFTPLGSVSIYTLMDTVPLKDVFISMRDKLEEHPLPDNSADNEALSSFFSIIVKDYDPERVYPSDIKKIIRWYQFMVEKGILDEALTEENTSDEEE